MGNKLCAPLLKRSYRNDSYPWNIRKDSHLLRLWADVFRVHGDGEYMRWQRVSDDVVPINITCIEDNPNTIFQITAYNRHVEKIFDVKITQPGTIICPATECFVHWRDTTNQCEWGLNFQTATDACRFKDCCSFPTHRFARKASSASSLRLSPPKRIRSKATSASSPSSPVHQRQIPPDAASPESCDHVDALLPPGGSPGRHPIPHSSPSPEREIQHMSSFKPPDDVMDRSGYRYSAMIKPPSDNSMYDNVTGSTLQRQPATTKNRIMYRKSIPMCSSATSSPARSLDEGRPASAISSITGDTSGSPNHSRDTTQIETCGTDIIIIDKVSIDSPKKDPVHLETAFIGDAGSGSSRPTSSMSQGARLTVDTSVSGASRNTSSSESPEWPSPPEPLTPQTPLTPLYSMAFDSDAIQRMLRSLPASPVEKEDKDLGFHDDPHYDGTDHNGTRRASGLSRTKSLNVHDRNSRLSLRAKPVPEQPLPPPPKLPDFPKSKQLTKILVEQELLLRNQCAASTYPDSGIGGFSGETSGSLMSEDSGRMAQFKSGPGVNHDLRGRSSGGSSGGSRSSTHSDIINQLGEGGDVRQYLTVDVSDEDGGESDTGSVNTMTESESQLSYGRQVGAIRKAGWLVVKNWLVHKKRKIELATRRSWRRYWMCLKGTTLLFFDCDEETAVNQNSVPRHILVIEGGITQAVPEHPKRDNIFSLSTACGDAYLLQASSQNDLENWIRAIHSACASSYARQHGKDNTLKLLKSELHKFDQNIDTDVKMKKMAELQMTVVSDPRSRVAIAKQIAQWEENLEKLFIEQYRFRCYVASLQGTELPNPKVLLANASKVSKTTLGRLGIFTVTSFHALVCARKPLIVPNIYGKGVQKGGMLSPKAENPPKPRSRTPTALMGAGVSTDAVFKTGNNERLLSDSMDNLLEKGTTDSHGTGTESLSRVMLPNNQTMLVGIDKRTTVRDLLESTCNKRQLNPRDHYVRIKPLGAPENKFLIPDRNACIKGLRYEAIEVCQKSIFQLELTKASKEGVFGFAVEAELAEDFDRDDELQVYVCDVTAGCVAEKRGLIVGDELLVINGKIVSELDMVYIEMLLHESRTLFLTVRSFRTQPPHNDFITEHANAYIDNMVLPPPPSQSRISDKVIGNLIVPAPANQQQNASEGDKQAGGSGGHKPGSDQIDALLRGAEQVTAICRNSNTSLRSHSPDSAGSSRPMSDAQRMRKVIMELIETERAYVKDLNCLTDRYLEPLKEETFLTSDEIDQLFGNIQEIVIFQRQFLHSLEEAIDLEKDFFVTTDATKFKRVLFSLGGSFLYYANHFKVYSSFCASHSRSQKIFNLEASEALKNFLRARNPKQQHSATLESYLIKPIQRILKYPLLLQQLCHLTQPDTDEHHHLSEALRGMEAVAEHINEMQKIYEEYGSVFDDLSKTFKEVHPSKKAVDLSVGELQMYGMVEWCNMHDYLGKTKKAMDFENTVFVFRSGVVFLCRERLKRRKTRSLPPKVSLLEHHHLDMLERFRTLIPTQEVQVRVGKVSDIDRHFWWELIHSRSDGEGRPERVYQFCNSTSEAKSDFMKVIRQTIRESVRSMTVPSKMPQQKGRCLSPCSAEKLDPLPVLNKKRGQDPERHSMDFDEKISALEYETLFRTRSKTIGDINQASLEENSSYTTVSEPQISAQNKSPSSSNSNLSSSSHSGSAKLLYASANPLNYSSGSVNSGGSPIWKPRSEKTQGSQSPQNQSPKHSVGPQQDDNVSRNSTGTASDASGSPKHKNPNSDSPKRKDTKTVVFATPYGVQPFKDTEC